MEINNTNDSSNNSTYNNNHSDSSNNSTNWGERSYDPDSVNVLSKEDHYKNSQCEKKGKLWQRNK